MHVSGQKVSTRKDFFISHNSADIRWAEWIAWQLEEAGYTVVLQAWDFRPGQNFVLGIDKAIRQARQTLAILSPAYLNGPYTQPEWAEAFRRDPTGEEGLLVPVFVQDCEVAGFLGQVIPIHLVGQSEPAAIQTLLAGVKSRRAKPGVPPSFPGSLQHSVPLPTRFPGTLPRIHTNLSPRNSFCIGRDQILEEAQRSLTAGVSVALAQPSQRSDPGPMGRNQTAREYMYRYQSDYRDVFWLDASSHSSLFDDFRHIARVLTLQGNRGNDQQSLIADVKNWFDTHTDWLLVFDNVENDQQIQPFLPQSNNGHILLTCQVLSPGSITRSLELPVSRPEEKELIQRLARTVGGSLTSPSTRDVLDLYRPTTIGRAPNNTIVLNDPTVAPYHAEIQLTGQGYTLRNQDARNGTRINGQPLHAGETRVLSPSNIIMLGNTTLSYQAGNQVQPGQGTPGFSPSPTPQIPVSPLNQVAGSPSHGPTNTAVPLNPTPLAPIPHPHIPSPSPIISNPRRTVLTRRVLIGCIGATALGFGATVFGCNALIYKALSSIISTTPMSPATTPTSPATTSTNLQSQTYISGDGAVTSIAWSPDGTMFASGDTLGTINIWSVEASNHKPVAPSPYQRPKYAVTAITWSPDGQSIAAGYDDNTIQIWKRGTPKNPSVSYTKHESPIQHLAWSSQPNLIASVSSALAYDIHIWDATTGTLLNKGPLTPGLTVSSLVWSYKSSSLAISANIYSMFPTGTLRIWDQSQKKPRGVPFQPDEFPPINAVAWKEDDTQLLVATGTNLFRMTPSMTRTSNPTTYPAAINAVCWKADLMYVACSDGALYIEDGISNEAIKYPIPQEKLDGATPPPNAWAWSPDGKYLAYGMNKGGKIMVWLVTRPKKRNA